MSSSDKEVLDLIDYIYTNNPTYWKRRISAILKADYNLNVGVKKVRKFMNILWLEPIYPKPKTSIKNSQHKIFPYLLKDIEINKVWQVYWTDTTYIKTKFWRLYLTALLDWYSRFIVSFALSFTLERFAVIQTVHIASKILLPEIINSDQWSQFTSTDYTETVLNYWIKLSMDWKWSYFDNIFTERLWRTIKTEEVYLSDYETPIDAVNSITNYIIKYNFERPHSALWYKRPYEIFNNISKQDYVNIILNSKILF